MRVADAWQCNICVGPAGVEDAYGESTPITQRFRWGRAGAPKAVLVTTTVRVQLFAEPDFHVCPACRQKAALGALTETAKHLTPPDSSG